MATGRDWADTSNGPRSRIESTFCNVAFVCYRNIEALTHDLVASLVTAGLVAPEDADALTAAVLAQVDSAPPKVTLTLPAPNGANGWFVSSPVGGTVRATDPSNVTALTCTGATVGPVTGLGAATATAPVTVSGDGVHAISCTATDGRGNSGAASGSTATATVRIDTARPTMTCRATPDVLSPPNGKLVPVTVSVQTTDASSGAGPFALILALSSEPESHHQSDIVDWTLGTPDTSGKLRADSDPHGHGRIYALTYKGSDTAGNIALCVALVLVPRGHTHDFLP